MPQDQALTAPSCSIVIEWANTQLTRESRTHQMLECVRAQCHELLAHSASAPRPPLEVTAPFEIIVVYDSEEVEAGQLAEQLSLVFAPDDSAFRLRLVPAPRTSYYQLKNVGARAATGDWIVFVDSDVIPEPAWLQRLLGALGTPGVRWVGGHTCADAETPFERAFSLVWQFPDRGPDEALLTKKRFWANNFATQRHLFLAHPFPLDEPNKRRGACALLSEHLRAQGLSIHYAPQARTRHECPDGWESAFRQALSHGHDAILTLRRIQGIKVMTYEPALILTQRVYSYLHQLNQRRNLVDTLNSLPLFFGYNFVFAVGMGMALCKQSAIVVRLHPENLRPRGVSGAGRGRAC